MERTFMGENERKDKLFEALNQYLEFHYPRASKIYYEEVYEGLATVLEISKNCIDFQLENGKKLKNIPVSAQISAFSSRRDSMYVFLGRNRRKWRLLDVTSIGSIVDNDEKKGGGIHLTFNPLFVNFLSKEIKDGEEKMH